MAGNNIIEVLDWNGNRFNDLYATSYCGERVAFVPQITIDGRNQLQTDFWVRYYVFDSETPGVGDHIVGCVLVGPGSLPDVSPYKPNQRGLTIRAIEVLGLSNVYDMESVSGTIDVGQKYIGYEIFADDGNQNPDYGSRLASTGNFEWPGYPDISDGWFADSPVEITSGSATPYVFQMNKARPTVSFIGNIEEVEYNPETPQEVYYASGFELSYTNDYKDAFRNAIADKTIAVIIGDPPGDAPVVSGSDIGTYTSQIRPSDLRVYQGENSREDYDLWRNFEPTFKVNRQIKLIIKGEEVESSGIGVPVSASKYYDSLLWAPEVKAPESATVRYSITEGVWSDSPIGITDVGSIYVTVEVSNIPGETEAQYYYYYLQVLPRPIYITSDSMSWNYDGDAHTCDWVTVQGHGEGEDIQTRFEPDDPEVPRIISNIPLITQDDHIVVKFKGGQTEIGSSNNSFDFEVVSDKPNNYDVRAEFGLLKVNLNSEDIYVYIRGNSKGTGEEYELERDRVCVYNGGLWFVSGYQVVAVDSHNDFLIRDPENDNRFIEGPSYSEGKGDLWLTYSAKDVSFVGDEKAMEVSGIYINDNPNSWLSEEYVSDLSDQNFKNTNSNFSNRNIHFIVVSNRLLISKREIAVMVSGHTREETFDMAEDPETHIYKPVWYSVEGCEMSSEDNIYDTKSVGYLRINDRDGEIFRTPTAYGCIWREVGADMPEDPDDGRWYMHLDSDMHDGESDGEEQFIDGFINNDKNFEVTFEMMTDRESNILDGWLLINPLEADIYIRGSQNSLIYDSETHSITGTRPIPEIWWRSGCEFYNQYARLEAENLEAGRTDPDDPHWVAKHVEIETEDLEESSSRATPVKYDRTYYRAIHDMGHFEWSNDGDTGSHTDINELIGVGPDDRSYWISEPYAMDLDIGDFRITDISDSLTQFTDHDPDVWGNHLGFEDTPNHIYYNLKPKEEAGFDLKEDGYLEILPYKDEVKVSVKGNTSSVSYTGGEQSVSGYESGYPISDTDIYYPDDSNYVSGPEDPSATGTDTGVYNMGLSSRDFKNVNKNFSNVVFLVVDGWIQIGPTDIDQDVSGGDSGYKVFDNEALLILDPTGVSNPKRYVLNPDYNPSDPSSEEWIEEQILEVYDSGEFQFKIESDGAGGVVDVRTSAQITPLRLSISSDSQSWIYDGSSHNNHTINISILNGGEISNINSVTAFVQSIRSVINTGGMPDITEPGSVANSFEIGNISSLFSSGVDNKTYIINGMLYENGEIIGGADMNSKYASNVIITISFGILEVSDGFETVTITGLKETILYDGKPHTLRGYAVDPPLDIPLLPSIDPDTFYEDTTDKRDASDNPYTVHLSADDFDWPTNIANRIIGGDIELTILKRPLRITTGSDTSHFDDEDPVHTARNETYTVSGIANTDHISPNTWASLSASGSIPNEMTYDILHENGDNVRGNYDITEVWGLLKIRHASDAEVYYRIMGIRKNITTPEADKVHIRGLKRIDGLERIVDEDRFYPALHKLVPIPEDGEVDADEVICIVPVFKYGKKIEDVTWMFENRSTGERFFSKVHDRPIFPDGNYGGARPAYKDYGGLADTPVLNVIPRELKPGYYDVTVNYMMDHTEYSQKFSSVFVIRKKS